MSARPLISACLIVNDEEDCLARCLESVQGLVAEIVVVDTGSADSTRDCACSWGTCVRETLAKRFCAKFWKEMAWETTWNI